MASQNENNGEVGTNLARKAASFYQRTALRSLIVLACLIVVITTIGLRLWLKHDAEINNKVVPTLQLGTLDEKRLASGESSSYRVSLDTGDYLRLVVEQQDIETEIAILDPNGSVIADMDSPYGKNGPISVSAIAEVAGEYKVEAHATTGETATGLYRLKVEDLRLSTTEDRSRVNAERAYMAGRKMNQETTKRAWEMAAGKLRESLSYWQSAKDPQEVAKTLYSLGETFSNLENMEAAAAHFQKALRIQRSLKDRWAEGYALNQLGLAYAHFDQNKALKTTRQALDLWEAQGDRGQKSLSLNILGGIHDNIGNPYEALEYFRQALAIRREIQNKEGEASTLNNIGVIYDEFGESQEALNHYQKSLSVVENVTSLEGKKIRGRALNNSGYTYVALGNPEKALQYCKQALAIQKEIDDGRGEARTLMVIGFAYNAMNKVQDALDSYNQSLAILKEIPDHWGQVYILAYIGHGYALLNEHQKALKFYNQALALQKLNPYRHAKATILDLIGQVYTSLNQPKKAFQYYGTALALWRVIGDRRGQATSLLGVASAQSEFGNLREAQARIKEALGIIEFLRTKVAGQEARILYFASVRQYYDVYINLLMSRHRKNPQAGFNAVALQASERARGRSLFEILVKSQADIRRGIEPALLEREHNLRQQLTSKEARQIDLLSARHTQKQKATVERETKDLLKQYEAVQAEIRSSSPRYAELIQSQPLNLKQIQQQVLDPDTIFLEYFLSDKSSYLWAVTDSSINSYELPKRSELEAQAEIVYKLLKARQNIPGESQENYNARVAEADTKFWPEAAKLSQMLLGPVASILGKKRLFIVTEGGLQYVPFGVLPVPVSDNKQAKGPIEKVPTDQAAPDSLTPLIVEHEIAYHSSASVLALMRRELADRQPAPKAVAVIADPVFNKDDPRVKSKGKDKSQGSQQPYETDLSMALRDFALTTEGLKLPRLHSLRREAEHIAEIVPREECLKALDFDACMAKATSAELKEYRIIHFATHGLLNNENPGYSAIVLSLVNEQGESQNGLLKLNDIYNLNLPAELVVLSACDTGLGKQIRGEGLVGLTRGFMYAGAARVVASLWKVNSVKTEKLMNSFYKGMLVEGLRPIEALQRAQIEMWKDSPEKAPYDWGAFILQGEWR